MRAVWLAGWSLASCANADFFYVANGNNTISRVDSGGSVTLFANTLLQTPQGLAVDMVGRLYVANQFGNNVVRYDSGGNGTVFAATGLSQPIGIGFDSAGSLFVANAASHTIMKYDQSGNGTLFADGVDGISNPVGIAIDGSDNVYVASQFLGTVHKFAPDGTGSVFASGLDQPYGLAFAGGMLYVGTAADDKITKFDSGGTPTAFASTAIDNPIGIAVDSGGNVYAANLYLNSITKFTPGGADSAFVSSGLGAPTFIAAVPEPSTLAGLAVTIGVALGMRHRFRGGPSRKERP